MTKLPYDKYTSREYLSNNPSWDSEDSPWKANLVRKTLEGFNIRPATIGEVGCGSGAVLANLRSAYPQAELFGYDIAIDATSFWPAHAAEKINFSHGDFFSKGEQKFDVLLVLDVIEHVPNPFEFLLNLKDRASYFVFHFPLDLSALSVLQEQPLLNVRNGVGHIHYFTKNLALTMLQECGYDIVSHGYSGAAFSAPRRTLKTIIASLPRILAYTLNKDVGVRLLGGETLIVLAKSNAFDN